MFSRLFTRGVGTLTATSAALTAAGLLTISSYGSLEASETDDKVRDLEPPKLDEGKASPEKPVAPPPDSSAQNEYGIFLSTSVKQKLMKLYPSKFSDVYADHVMINNDLSTEDRAELDKLLGTQYQIVAQALISDEQCQALLINCTDPRPEFLPPFANVTISTNATPDLSAIALERTISFLREKLSATFVWSGTLPPAQSLIRPDLGTLPVTAARYELVDNIKFPGVLCTRERWDAETGTCAGAPSPSPEPDMATFVPGAEERCPFCLYMEAGPCCDVFLAWEACLLKYDDDPDLFEKCAKPTIKLKECIDAHPDYHEALIGAAAARDAASSADSDGDSEATGTTSEDTITTGDATSTTSDDISSGQDTSATSEATSPTGEETSTDPPPPPVADDASKEGNHA